jgi:NinG protein
MKIRFRFCKVCESPYEVNPNKLFIGWCSIDCGYKYQKILREKKAAKEWRDEKKVLKEKLKTHKDYLNDLQIVFNTFIRMRDKDKLCICCDKPLIGKFDAGHYFSVGGNPALRFNEDNVHAQRVHCNRDKHGNLIEYGIMLPFRIGHERFKELEQLRNTPLKLSIPEIKELIIFYKQKIKTYENT